MTPLKLHTGNIIGIFSADTETELCRDRNIKPNRHHAVWRYGGLNE
jgi:hypothetical protein